MGNGIRLHISILQCVWDYANRDIDYCLIIKILKRTHLYSQEIITISCNHLANYCSSETDCELSTLVVSSYNPSEF